MLTADAQELSEEYINSGKILHCIVCSEKERMHLQRVDRIVEVVSWKMKRDKTKN